MCNLSLQADHFEDYVFGLFAFIVRRKKQERDRQDEERRRRGAERWSSSGHREIRTYLKRSYYCAGNILNMKMDQLKLHFCLRINGLRQLWSQHT